MSVIPIFKLRRLWFMSWMFFCNPLLSASEQMLMRRRSSTSRFVLLTSHLHHHSRCNKRAKTDRNLGPWYVSHFLFLWTDWLFFFTLETKLLVMIHTGTQPQLPKPPPRSNRNHHEPRTPPPCRCSVFTLLPTPRTGTKHFRFDAD